MWYVIQVYSGKEKYVKELIKKYECSKNIEDCKIPVCVRMKKRNEIWYPETKVMFPGYLFVRTGNIAELYRQLKAVPGMTKLLGIGKEIIPIALEEEKFLIKAGGNDMVVGLSKGIMENGRVRIVAGSLQGMEGSIIRIDRHKRLAWVNVRICGKVMQIPLGLEVINAL